MASLRSIAPTGRTGRQQHFQEQASGLEEVRAEGLGCGSRSMFNNPALHHSRPVDVRVLSSRTLLLICQARIM